MLRKAMFSGSFYDSNPNRLQVTFENWFNQAETPDIKGKIIGVICPHAGYIYSGFCAAHSYKILFERNVKTAIIVHPSHRGNHFGFSVSPYREYQTPLGNLYRNDEMAEELLKYGAEEIDDWYHQNEHSLEVQLPFVHYLNPEINIVPVMIGNQSLNVSNKLSEVLFKVLTDEVVIIVSTDLSHYHSADEAKALDRLLITRMISKDLEDFYNNIRTGKIEACGFAGIMTLMQLSNHITDSHIQELFYTHSGITSGDFNQVVGYLSATLTKG